MAEPPKQIPIDLDREISVELDPEQLKALEALIHNFEGTERTVAEAFKGIEIDSVALATQEHVQAIDQALKGCDINFYCGGASEAGAGHQTGAA